MQDLTFAIEVLTATSILFVWVVRYDNIVAEFQEFGLPSWLRDLVGILKLSFALMLLVGGERPGVTSLAGWGIALLMLCAQVVHLRAHTSFPRRLPSLALFVMGVYLAL